MNEIKLNTGAVKYAIKDAFGDEIGTIKFNPNDIEFLRRYEDTRKWFGELKVEKNLSMDDFFKLTDAIKARFDYLLNTNASETVFKVANPLSKGDNGEPYCVTVLKAIEGIVQETMTNKAKKFDAAVKDIVG